MLKDLWIKSDTGSQEPARAGPGPDFAERHLRWCSAGCIHARDLKIGTHRYLVMLIEIFRKFSDPDHFKYLPASCFRNFIVNYCENPIGSSKFKFLKTQRLEFAVNAQE